jgi:branched-subunit amino acid aminotransferase/4-amino-4-deoxychorismate lyase
MNEPQAFLNGAWIPASAAVVSVGDAGFVLGATVAEQLRTFAGKLFHLDDHLARLAHSLEIVGVDPGMSVGELAEVARELVARNHPLVQPGDDLGLSVFVTPGNYPAYEPPGPRRPTVCLHTYPLPFHLWAKKYREGQALVTTRIEQVPPHCWPADLKCRSRMHYYLADRQAAAVDPQARALLLDAQGFVTEASTANVLAYIGGEGLVASPSTKILRGISQSVTMELAGRLGISSAQRNLTTDDVAAAEEVFLTSTPLCLLPVVRFNGRPIGAGRPGKIFGELLSAWSEMVGVDVARQAERFARNEEGCRARDAHVV